jgi:hypothetical protein
MSRVISIKKLSSSPLFHSVKTSLISPGVIPNASCTCNQCQHSHTLAFSENRACTSHHDVTHHPTAHIYQHCSPSSSGRPHSTAACHRTRFRCEPS